MTEHEKSFDDNNLRDFIDVFIAERKERNDCTFTVREILYCLEIMKRWFYQWFCDYRGTATRLPASL